MPRCSYCGAEITATRSEEGEEGEEALCPYHHSGLGANWAEGNRLMCDFIHRGRIPARLPKDLRSEDEVWIFAEAAGT
ncbi:MAG: hypothetical protein HY220_02380 [Candidatus Sungbacteria bacterium]|uniref:Uncharacterized protein n=1 Tax=Candidatus Sungiibacteriota bacterium TaxID=2750080 RepID=A0A9D6LNF6_9BACT|nr:hypothetical protein [Candidatus Sungbacteria bacterium]